MGWIIVGGMALGLLLAAGAEGLKPPGRLRRLPDLIGLIGSAMCAAGLLFSIYEWRVVAEIAFVCCMASLFLAVRRVWVTRLR